RLAAEALLTTLHTDDRVLVLGASADARVVHPMTSDHALARAALASLTPTDAPGDAREALSWAASLCAAHDPASEAPACAVHVITDGGLAHLAERSRALRDAGVEVHLALVTDTHADDVGITALSARRFPADPSRAELLVELTSFASSPVSATLSIFADGQLAHREPVTLAPGQSVRRTLDELTGADALFEARLSRDDGAPLDVLGVDDVAWARLAPRRRRRALLVTATDDVYLQAALLLDPYLDVATLSPEAYESTGIPADRELVIFDGVTPSAPPSAPSLLLAPTSTPWLGVGEPLSRPHFDTQDRDHPLLAFVALRDVNIATARPLLPAPGDETIAGEARGALLAPGTRERTRFVALGLDVRESDLPLRIAWPILVLDAIAFLAPDDLTLAPSAQTGRAFPLALSAPHATLTRRGDGTASAEAAPIDLAPREGRAELTLDHAGVYDLAIEGQASRIVVANLFDRDEPRLDPVRLDDAVTIDADAASEAVASRERRDAEAPRWPLHVLLVIGALALLALEWITFHRRWTT
ncbi:MAG: hypothetical protein K1X94_34865, partial [Sandaracinaceae bacterium]|nr:hypothetical protein [Sandaracinaceae bacterium]